MSIQISEIHSLLNALPLDEHEQIVKKMHELFVIRKLIHCIVVVSNRSMMFADRLSELESMMDLMMNRMNFNEVFSKYAEFVDATPAKMMQIREELVQHIHKDPERVERLCERLQRVSNLYARKTFEN